MPFRDLFRGPSSSNNERKSIIPLSTSSLVPVLDANTFVNAAQDKDTDTLQKYLLAGISPDQTDPSTKLTALHVAVESANIRAVQMLIQAGAQVNGIDLSGSTPLHIAAYMGYEEIVQILLSHDADMYKQDNTGRNPFHLAVSTGNIRLIQHFLSGNDTEQIIIHLPDAQNWTPLMCACVSNHPVTCAFLLSHHADLCAVNDRGMTVFHLAAFVGSLSVLQELLSSSSNESMVIKAINQGDHRNQTVLFHACIEGHLDIALTLLRAGADVYHLDNDDQTCLHAMLSSSIILKRHIRLFYSLIQFVDYRFNQDYLGRTLLDLAYANQLKTIIHLLLMLNYKTNSDIVFNSEQIENSIYQRPSQVLSLRQICVLCFKRSIVYQRNRPQLTQRELLENALQQTFQLTFHRDSSTGKENQTIEKPIGKSLDDFLLLHRGQQQSNKYHKNVKSIKNQDKKMRKTANIFSTTTTITGTSSTSSKWSSQTDLQHPQSTWSTFTNKLKGQRLPIVTTNTPSPPSTQSATIHPMKHLAFDLLISPVKIDYLLDFPSLNNNPLLYEDLKMSISTYNLLEPDILNRN